MKVRELIVELSHLQDQEAEICVEKPNGGRELARLSGFYGLSKISGRLRHFYTIVSDDPDDRWPMKGPPLQK